MTVNKHLLVMALTAALPKAKAPVIGTQPHKPSFTPSFTDQRKAAKYKAKMRKKGR